MKDKEIIEHFNILKELIFEMLVYGKLLLQFHKKHKYYQKYLDLSPVFFSVMYRSLWTSLILSIMKVYGFGPNYKRSLPKLLNVVKNNLSSFSKTAEAKRLGLPTNHYVIANRKEITLNVVLNHERIIGKLPINKICYLRDKRYAHFDKIDITELLKAKIQIRQIKRVLSIAKIIWNLYHQAYRADYCRFFFYVRFFSGFISRRILPLIQGRSTKES